MKRKHTQHKMQRLRISTHKLNSKENFKLKKRWAGLGGVTGAVESAMGTALDGVIQGIDAAMPLLKGAACHPATGMMGGKGMAASTVAHASGACGGGEGEGEGGGDGGSGMMGQMMNMMMMAVVGIIALTVIMKIL